MGAVCCTNTAVNAVEDTPPSKKDEAPEPPVDTREPELNVKIHGVAASANCCSPILLAMELKVGAMEFVNLQEGHHKQEAFLAINPVGTVPALEDGNVKGGESNAILRYLAAKYGPAFYPLSSPATCFKIDFALDDFVSNVYPSYTDVVYVAAGFQKEPSAGTQAEANKKFGEAVNAWLATHLVGKFGLGEQISLMDVKALPYFYAAMQPLIKQKVGFVLSEKAKSYVEDVMKALPESSKFLQEGDYSILKLCASLEGGEAAEVTPEEPFTPGTPVQVGEPGGAGTVKVHALPPSQNACGAVLMAMEAKVGEMAFCDIMSGAHKKPEFLAINPSAKIPSLEDGSVKGGESMAIMRYLALSYAPSFYPKENVGDCFYIDFAMDDFQNKVYPAHVDVVYPVFGFKDPAADKEAAHTLYKEKIEKWMKDHVRGPFVLGANVSIADVKAVPYLFAAMQPAVKQAGFVPPAKMEKYVQDIQEQVGATSFLESAGGHSIKEFLATK